MLKLVKTEPTLQGLKDGVQGINRTANGSLLTKMQKPRRNCIQPSSPPSAAKPKCPCWRTRCKWKSETLTRRPPARSYYRQFTLRRSATSGKSGGEAEHSTLSRAHLNTGKSCTIHRMVKVIQLNLNHCRAAQDLLAQTVIEQQDEVSILSEPYKDKHEGVWQPHMEGVFVTGDANTCARNLGDRVKKACDASMEKATKNGNGRRPVPWWNQELRERTYRAKRKVLKNAIKASKARCFQELCEAAVAKPFGSAYRMVMATGEGDTVLTSEAEVLAELRKTKIEKAPGPDCIPNAALHTLVANYPGIFKDIYNRCLTQRTFPIRWKRQRLVLIPKPGKLNDDASSYRPLCMLNTTGKIFERIICTHLEKELDQLRALADHQFGFRRKRSTIDAIQTGTQLAANAIEGERWLGGSKEYCLVCTLDVKNAFNSANWNLVLQAFHRMGISNYLIDLVADYFKDRVLTYSSSVGEHEYLVTGGVPQGSVLGPILWNVISQSIQIDCSHLKDDGQYSRTKAAQQKDHSHCGDIYHTTLRTAHHKQLLHGIRGSRASGSRYYTDRPAGGRTKDWEHRKQDRSNTIEAWQRRWNNATTGRGTHSLIPSLTPWLQRRHGQVDFYLISGHGCSKEYLVSARAKPLLRPLRHRKHRRRGARAIHLPPIR
ncbi:uncharacterized protein [Drosophila suzukii]|uniref:Reverse transcriptase domain-containing protein n=1 Tax=Drosophila suzukii TaxID=28584 RepID=A0ABM4TYE7_DROSZ